jgi:hypothetical protein
MKLCRACEGDNRVAYQDAMSLASYMPAGPLDCFTAAAGNQLRPQCGGTLVMAVGVLTYGRI